MNRDHLKAGEKACTVRETRVIQYLSVFEVTGVDEVKCNTEKAWGGERKTEIIEERTAENFS